MREICLSGSISGMCMGLSRIHITPPTRPTDVILKSVHRVRSLSVVPMMASTRDHCQAMEWQFPTTKFARARLKQDLFSLWLRPNRR